MTGEFTIVAIGAGVVFILAFLMREVSCWYFKINEQISLQKEIIDLLKSIEKNTTRES
ncbi:MAG: hypothetical protein ACOYNC_02550 [Bacteroidales bacterium]